MAATFVRLKRSKANGLSIWPLVCLLCATHSWAQTAPDAGSVRQLIEQPRLTPPAPARREPLLRLPPELRNEGTLRVAVREFRFAGNTLLSNARLDSVLQPFVGRALNFADLQRAANSAAAAYRQAGWIVRIYLPEQDIASGTVTLQIVEAQLGQVRFEGQPPQRVLPAELQAYFANASNSSEPLRAAALERAQLLVDDLPGVKVLGTLAAGADAGQTDVLLRATDKPWVTGDAGLDNSGARSTGSHRVTANIYLNSPGLRGELISLNALRSAGSDYARVAMTVPVPDFHNGLRFGVNGSTMTYKVIDGPSSSASSPIQGRSGALGLQLIYPLLRSLDQNLYLSGHLDNKSFYTQDTLVRSDYASNILRLELSGNSADEWLAGGGSSASVQLLWGQLSHMTAHNQLDTIERQYRKLSYSLSRQQSLTDRHAVLLSLSGQYATQRLDSSERFYIGGSQSVRAYPASELGGDRGELLGAEWRWRLDSTWTLSAFVDHGRVASVASAADAATRSALRGHGLGIDWQGPRGWLARASWARRNGVNPQPSSTGTDSDGSLQYNRLWFTTSVNF